MVKGFVFFKEGKIPFVIGNYRMELFTDDHLLNDFSKEYNFKTNYILQGQYFGSGFQGQKATFLVKRSMGSTCYLRCYIINMLASQNRLEQPIPSVLIPALSSVSQISTSAAYPEYPHLKKHRLIMNA